MSEHPVMFATIAFRRSVPNPGDAASHLRARCEPLVVGLKLQPELVVEDLEVAVSVAHDCFRHDHLHFLRHDADISLLAAVVAEAIETKAVLEMAEKDDVVLKRSIGPPATAASSSATTRGHTGRSSATHAGRSSTTHPGCSCATMRGHA